MHIPPHQILDRGIDKPMPGERRKARELTRDDANVEVPPVAGTRVVCVQGAVVAQFEFARLERLQPLAQAIEAVAAHGSCPGPAESGDGAWRCSQTACAITKANVSAVMPKTLKFTQVCSSDSRATARLAAPIAR